MSVLKKKTNFSNIYPLLILTIACLIIYLIYFADRQNLSGVKAISKIQGLFLQALYNKIKHTHEGKLNVSLKPTTIVFKKFFITYVSGFYIYVIWQ